MSAPEPADAREGTSEETRVLDPKKGLVLFLFVLISFLGTLELVKWLFKVAPPDRYNDFTIADPQLDFEEVERSISLGMLRPLVDPEPIPAEKAPELRHKFVVSSDRVAVVTIGGETRGYLLRVLVYHEFINDTLGGVPITIVHQPVSDLVSVYERTIQGQTLAFGTSGLQLDSHVLAYDQPPMNDRSRLAESSLWSPMLGIALAGPRSGERLKRIPVEVTTWGDFRTRFPEGTIPLPPPDYLKQYRKDPYTQYLGAERPRFDADPMPEDPSTFFDRTIVVAGGGTGEIVAYRTSELLAEGSVQLTRTQGDLTLNFRVVDREKEIVAVTAASGTLDWTLQTFWFTWFASRERVEQVAAGQPLSDPRAEN